MGIEAVHGDGLEVPMPSANRIALPPTGGHYVGPEMTDFSSSHASLEPTTEIARGSNVSLEFLPSKADLVK